MMILFVNLILQEKEGGGSHNMSAFHKCSCGVSIFYTLRLLERNLRIFFKVIFIKYMRASFLV